MDIGRAEQNVHDLIQLFPNSFAVYGTALGANREKHVIAHDLDTDIGILSENFSWDFVNAAVREGFTIRAVFGMRYHGMEIAFYRDEVKTDLMLFYPHPGLPGFLYNCLWRNGGRNGMNDEIVHMYAERHLVPIEGSLGEYTIPTLGEDYLVHVYGRDWRIPIKKWDWQNDHLCKKTG